MTTYPTVGYGSTRTSEEIAERCTLIALEAGYRVINTCMAYHNLAGMGRAISKSGISRDDLFIVVLDENEGRSSENAKKFDGYSATKSQIYNALSDLATDMIDLYMINWPIPRYMENEWRKLNADSWRAMEESVDNGMIRYIGVSNFYQIHLDELQKTAKLPISAAQLEIHSTFQQRELVNLCKNRGMNVSAWSPLCRGEAVKLPKIIELAQKYGKTSAQIILRWDLQHGIMPIVSSSNPERIRGNFDVFDFSLSEKDMLEIDKLENGKHIECWSYGRVQRSLEEKTV